jgi:hypothetical protein
MLNNTVRYDTLISLAYLLYSSSYLTFLATHYSSMTITIITITIREALSERIRLCPWEGEGGYS